MTLTVDRYRARRRISRSRACSPASGRSPTWSATAARSTSSRPRARHARLRRRRPHHLRHGRSLRLGRDDRGASARGERRDPVQLLTKWVPKPGPLTREDVREAVERSLQRLRTEPDRSPAVPRVELRRSVLARRPLPSAGAEARGPHRAPRPHQLRHRAPARGARQRHRDRLEPGVASRCSIGARAGRCRTSASRTACRLLAYGTLAGGLLTEALARPTRARLGTQRHLVADEVRPLHPRRRRLGRAPASAARCRRGGARGTACRSPTVASRYVLDQPAVAGDHRRRAARRAEHIDDNLRVFVLPLDRTRTAKSCEAALATLQPDPRRLRRRVPQAAVSHRLGRPESSRRVVPGALPGRSPRRRPHALL